MTPRPLKAVRQWSFWKALSIESIKYRRTATLRIAVGVPLAFYGMFLLGTIHNVARTDTSHTWERFAVGARANWAFLVFPFCTIILAAMASQSIQADRMWTRILVQPVTRRSAFVAHIATVIFLPVGSSLLFGIVTLGTEAFAGGAENLGWKAALAQAFVVGIAEAPTAVLQLWLGTRSSSLAIPLIIDNASLFAALVIHQRTHLITFPACSFFVNQRASQASVLVWSIGLTMLFSVVGLADFARRDFA